MAAELPRPGVEVLQVFRSVSPTIITPTLVPCVVGVCRQVVDVLSTTAAGGKSLNGDALVPLQARFIAKAATGSPAAYAGLDGLKLVLSLNNGPPVTVTFSGASLTPASVVAQVLAAFATANVTAFTAEVVGTTQWRLRSYAANELQTIKILGGTGESDAQVLTAFGLAGNQVFSGASYYQQYLTKVYGVEFPDPRRNLSQLVIEPSSVRAFLFLGGSGASLQELRQDTSFLRKGLAKPAIVKGTVDITGLTYPGDPGTKTVVLAIDGAANVTATFANPADAAALIGELNAVFQPLGVTASLETGTNYLVLTGTTLGVAGSIKVDATGTANATLGLTAATTTGTAAAEAVSDGSGLAVTSLVKLPGENFGAAPTAAAVTGTVDVSAAAVGDMTLTLDDGQGPQTLTFPTGTATGAAILTAINGLFGSAVGGFITATQNGSNFLVLTNSRLGQESIVKVVGGTALAALGLTASTVSRGNPYAPLPGDELWLDGKFYANIVEVSPGAQTDRLRIDRVVGVSNNIGVRSFVLVAKGLQASAASTGVTRPTPNLTVDTLTGDLTVKPEVIRDTEGNPISTGKGQLFVSYKAIRLDVTSKASSPGLLRFNDTTEVDAQIAPTTTENPLALGLYFALLNAPGTQVTGLGVDEVTAAAPFGTVDAFTRAAEFLEAFEVYALAPLTHDLTVAGVFATHATVMSAAENKGERVVLFNLDMPTNKLDTLVASGTEGDTTATPDQFDTKVNDLPALLLAADVSPVGTIPVSAGAYLDVGDGKKYSITSVSGGIVTVKTSSFAAGDNDDGYYATTTLPTPLISETFAVRVRGAKLVEVDGVTPDKDAIAETVQKTNAGFLNRRFWSVFPDKAAASIDGVEQVIDGFYMCAAAAGMIAKQPPQQSFTNFPMSGFTRVIGSNDRFSERQLNVMAAGGTYIIVQDAPATPLVARMALTTDTTSVETRTDSITKVVDFTAKFLRQGLKNFIGRFNITQGFLDSLGHVIQGLLGFLEDSGVLIGSNLNNLIQDETNPDTVIIDITLDVPFPCNYIRLTLVV